MKLVANLNEAYVKKKTSLTQGSQFLLHLVPQICMESLLWLGLALGGVEDR